MRHFLTLILTPVLLFCTAVPPDAALPDYLVSEITVTCAYYGDYRIGSKTYCYILRGDSFGYIPKPADLTYDENPEYEERLSQNVSGETTDSTDDEEQSGSTSPAQIAILIALCLLVPVLAALILKPPRRPPYEQED